jgi:hypothetical protein
MSVPKAPLVPSYVTCDCDNLPSDYCHKYALNKHPCPEGVQYVDTADIDYSKDTTFANIKWGSDKAQQYKQPANKTKKGSCSADQDQECTIDADCTTAAVGQTGSGTCEKTVTTHKTTYTGATLAQCCASAPCRQQNLKGSEDECNTRAASSTKMCTAKQKHTEDLCEKRKVSECWANCINNHAREYVGKSLGSPHFKTEEYGCVNVNAADKAGDSFYDSCQDMSDTKGKITQQDCLDGQCALQWRHWGQLYAQNSLPHVSKGDDCPASMGNPVGQLAQGGVYCTGSLRGAIQAYTEMNAKHSGLVDPRTCGGAGSVCCKHPPPVDPTLYNTYFHHKYESDSGSMVSMCSPIKNDDGTYSQVPSCDSSVTHTGTNCSLTVDQDFALFHGDTFCGTYSTNDACYKGAAQASSAGKCPSECDVKVEDRLVGHMTIGVNDVPSKEVCTGPSANYAKNNCWDNTTQSCHLKQSVASSCTIDPMERLPGKGKQDPDINHCLNVEGNCWEAKVYGAIAVPQCYLNETDTACVIPSKLRLQAYTSSPDMEDQTIDDKTCAQLALDPASDVCYDNCKTNHNCASGVPSCYLSKNHECNVMPDQRIYGAGVLNANNVPIPITSEKECTASSSKNCWDPNNGGIECFYPGTIDRCPAKSTSCSMGGLPLPAGTMGAGQYCAEAPGYECLAEPNLGGCTETDTAADFVCTPEGEGQWRLHMNGKQCTELYTDEQKCQTAIQTARDNRGVTLCTDTILGESICCRKPPCWHPVTPVPSCRSYTPIPIYDDSKRQYCTLDMSCDECAAAGGPPLTDGTMGADGKTPLYTSGVSCPGPGWCPPSTYGGLPYPQSLVPWCSDVQSGKVSLPDSGDLVELKTWCQQLVAKCDPSSAACTIPGQQCLSPPGYTCSLEYNHDTWCSTPPCWKPNPLVSITSCPEGPCRQEGQMCENGFVCRRQAVGTCTAAPQASGQPPPPPPLCWVPQSTPPPKRTCPQLRSTASDRSCEYPGQTCLDMPNWVCRNQVNEDTGCLSPPCWVGPVGSTTKCSSSNPFHKLPIISDYLGSCSGGSTCSVISSEAECASPCVWKSSPLRWVDFANVTQDCMGLQRGDNSCSESMENSVCFLEDYMSTSTNIFSGTTGTQGELHDGGIYICEQYTDPATNTAVYKWGPLLAADALPTKGHSLKNRLYPFSVSAQAMATPKPAGFQWCENIGQKAFDQFTNPMTCQWNDPSLPQPLCPDPTQQACQSSANAPAAGVFSSTQAQCYGPGTDQNATCNSDIQCQGCWIPDAVPTACTDSELDTVCYPSDMVFSSTQYLRLKAIADGGYICKHEKSNSCYNPPCWVPARVPANVTTCGTPLLLPADADTIPPCPAQETCDPDQSGDWCKSGETYKQCTQSGSAFAFAETTPATLIYDNTCLEGGTCPTKGTVCNGPNKDGGLDHTRQLICTESGWAPINPSTCQFLGQTCERTVLSSAAQPPNEAEIHRYICTPMNDEGMTDEQLAPPLLNSGRCKNVAGQGCWIRQWPSTENTTSGATAPPEVWQKMVRTGTNQGCDVANLGRIVDAGTQNMICINDVMRVPQLVPSTKVDPTKAGDQVYIDGEPQFQPICTQAGSKYCQGNKGGTSCEADAVCQKCQGGKCASGLGKCTVDADCQDQQCFLPAADPPCWAPSPKDPMMHCPPAELISRHCGQGEDGGDDLCPAAPDLQAAWQLQKTLPCNLASPSPDAANVVSEGDFLRHDIGDQHQFFQCVGLGDAGLVWVPYAKEHPTSPASNCCLLDISDDKGFICNHLGQECLPFHPNRYVIGKTPLPIHEGDSCLQQPYFINPTCQTKADAQAIHGQDASGQLLYGYGTTALTTLPPAPKPIPTWDPELCKNPAPSLAVSPISNNCICQFYCTPGADTYYGKNYSSPVPAALVAGKGESTLKQWCANQCSVNSACQANCVPDPGQGCFHPDPPPPTVTCPTWECEYANHICTAGPGYICKAQKTAQCDGPFCWVRAKHYTPDSTPDPKVYNQEGIPGLLTTCPENECSVAGQVCSEGPGYTCLNSVNTQTGCMEPPCWHRLSTSCGKVHTFDYDTWVQHQSTSLIYPGDCVLIPSAAEFPLPQAKTPAPGASLDKPMTTSLAQSTIFRYRGSTPIQYMLVNPMTALQGETQWIAFGEVELDNHKQCSPRQNIEKILNCPGGIRNRPYQDIYHTEPNAAYYCCSTGTLYDGNTPGSCDNPSIIDPRLPGAIYPVSKATPQENPDPSSDNVIRLGSGPMASNVVFDSLLNLRLSFTKDGQSQGHCLLLPWSDSPDKQIHKVTTSSGNTEYYARYYTPPPNPTPQEQAMCTVKFDSGTQLRLAPYGCRLYGVPPDPSSSYSKLEPCSNYVTPPPDWGNGMCSSKECTTCDPTLAADSTDGIVCSPRCRQWCTCIYQHLYVDNSKVWERILELDAGQGVESGSPQAYQVLNEIPLPAARTLISTAPPDKANQIDCQRQCTTMNDCVGFILDTSKLPVQCSFYKATGTGCLDCAAEQKCTSSIVQNQQWIYKKECSSPTPPAPTPPAPTPPAPTPPAPTPPAPTPPAPTPPAPTPPAK